MFMLSRSVERTFLGKRMSVEPNQDILGIEASYTMSRDNKEEWIEQYYALNIAPLLPPS